MTKNYSEPDVLAQLLAERPSGGDVVKPLFFRLGNISDRQGLSNLLEKKPYIRIFDSIDQQLTELIKSFHPKLTLSGDEIRSLVAEHLAGISKIDYGVWVYYPWNEILVHILDEDEFITMRTSRNRYKITQDEQMRLMTKRIGVIGLSVGQSVSLTLCMERGVGELRIADFDELEITNLNRLRSGLHNMGLKKTVIVAREIAEIDPFLKVTCYHEGITDANLENFLLHDGKLDLLIDECDGVDVKINCRLAAKKHGIPVLMEASDRGTVDIERFDLEPDRPILHGFVEHLDLSNVRLAKTMEEKLPYILPIVGIETMSTRLKASAIEIGQTISTWPQLASAVAFGGGMAADVSRRVLLGQFNQSGRYFIDLEELIGDQVKTNVTFEYTKRSLSPDEMAAAASRVPPVAEHVDTITESEVRELISAVAAAPSPGNNQPWKWYYDGTRFYLFHDIQRSESFGDFQNMASYMTFGTAIENLNLKAKDLGIKVIENLFPLEDEPMLIGAFSFVYADIEKDELSHFLTIRCTNRRKGNGNRLTGNILDDFRDAVRDFDRLKLKIVVEDKQVQRLASIAGEAEKLRLFIPQGHYELFEKELRWTEREALETKDGLDIQTLELSPKDAIGFRVARDPMAVKLVAEWGLGRALENMTADLMKTASAIGLVVIPAFDRTALIEAGKAVERIWLSATRNKVSMQPVLASVLHFARLMHGKDGTGMPGWIQNRFRELKGEFDSIFDNGSTEESVFLFRLFYGNDPQVKSLRLDADQFFIHQNNN